MEAMFNMTNYINSNAEYERYIVVPGDTLNQISQKFDVSKNWVKKLNGLSDDTIQPNQALKIGLILPKRPSVVIKSGDKSQNRIALTFDCGGSESGVTLDILEVLSKDKVKGTFFLTGAWAEKFPELAKAIVAGGHEIGNHSYSHPDFTKIGNEAIKQEIRKGGEVIKDITGSGTKPLIRYPYGAYNIRVLNLAGGTGYTHSIHWSLDTIDWKQPSVQFIVDRVLQSAKAGDIILFHIHGHNTAKASQQFIPALLDQGFQLVTVSELI